MKVDIGIGTDGVTRSIEKREERSLWISLGPAFKNIGDGNNRP
jgi:hypothetical protein